MRKRALACFGVLLAVTTACSGNGTADKPKQRPTSAASGSNSTADGPAPRPAAASRASDFNGDGYGDLVVTDSGATVQGVHDAGQVVVVYGSAKGPDTAQSQVIDQNDLGLGKAGQGGGFGSRSLSADLDGDGYADLIATAGSKSLFVVWGGKDGLSGAVAARLTGVSPVTGDFNGDGHTDLVAMDAETNVGTTDTVEGAATVALGPFTRAGRAHSTVPLDLSPDGKPDKDYYIATPSASGDVTGDGRDDLVVTWSHVYADEALTPRATVLYPGTPDGHLTAGPRLKDAQGEDLYGLASITADIDKDGYADIVLGLPCDVAGEPETPQGGSRVVVSYGGPDGQSTRLKPVRITEKAALPGSPQFVVCTFGRLGSAGDTNGDGYADVAVTGTVGRDYDDGQPTVILLLGSAKGLTTHGARLFSRLSPGIPGPDDNTAGFGDDTVLLDTDRDGAAELAISGRQLPGVTDAPIVWVLRGSARGTTTSRLIAFDQDSLGLALTTGRGQYGFAR